MSHCQEGVNKKLFQDKKKCHFFTSKQINVLKRFFAPSAGGEVEGSGSLSHVSFPNEEQRMDADSNQQLHLPEPLL